jgi:hypothetical protein
VTGTELKLGHYTQKTHSFVSERSGYVWLSDGTFVKEPIPTVFVQHHRGHLNDVMHAKPLGYSKGDYGNLKVSDGRCLWGVAEGLSTNARYTIVQCKGTYAFTIQAYAPQVGKKNTLSVELFIFYYSTAYNIRRRTCRMEIGMRNEDDGSRSVTVQSTSYMNKDMLMYKQLLTFGRVDQYMYENPKSSAPEDWWTQESEAGYNRYQSAHAALDLVSCRVQDWIEDIKIFYPKPASSSISFVDGALHLIEPKYNFLLGEDSWFSGLMQQRDQSYWMGYLINESYIRACESVPRMSENSISNALEIGSFLYTLFVKHRVEIPKSLGDAWLTYRYVYNTTKMDVKEAARFFKRTSDLRSVTEYKVYGNASTTYKGIPVSCCCSFTVKNKAVDMMQKLLNTLASYGLEPNAYVLWDMIPFSFIADWFLPIGDVLSREVSQRQLKQAFDVSDICFSFYYTQTLENDFGDKLEQRYYTRKYSSTPPTYHGFYEFENMAASSKVVGYRILDIASLILG